MKKTTTLAVLLATAWFSAPVESQGADTARQPETTLRIHWDAGAKKPRMELIAHLPLTSFDELKKCLQPISRLRVDKAVGASTVPLVLVPDQELPFVYVDKARAVCDDPSINMRWALRMAPEAKSKDAAKPPFKIRLQLKNGKVHCSTNGWPIGVLPAAAPTLLLQLKSAADRKLGVEIHPDPKVPHGRVVEVVDACMEAKATEITFTGALPKLKDKAKGR